jgi:hypothetical protein
MRWVVRSEGFYGQKASLAVADWSFDFNLSFKLADSADGIEKMKPLRYCERAEST